MYGFIEGNLLELQLSALQTENKLNILSSPSITTLDNQMAFTENGERVPYVSIDQDGNQEVNWEDAVLRLEITPNIIDAEQLKLAVKVKKDEVDTSRTVQGNPFIIKKQTETNLVVADGETIVISGLTKERGTSAKDGVPAMQDIPVLGNLFKKDSKGKSMEEVIIFITPHILPYRPVDYRPKEVDLRGELKQ
jgi:type IV pilus assembly protein PilQ